MFRISMISLDHEGGTKQYHLCEIHRTDGSHSVGVQRWGKTGAWGEMHFVEGAAADVKVANNKKLREKERRGYTVKWRKNLDVTTEREFKEALGDYYHHLGMHLTRLMKGVDWDDGLLHSTDPDDEVVEEPPAPEPKVSASKTNPKWGLF